jgi:hypothetical protein
MPAQRAIKETKEIRAMLARKAIAVSAANAENVEIPVRRAIKASAEIRGIAASLVRVVLLVRRVSKVRKDRKDPPAPRHN